MAQVDARVAQQGNLVAAVFVPQVALLHLYRHQQRLFCALVRPACVACVPAGCEIKHKPFLPCKLHIYCIKGGNISPRM
jgi:hypothetical protein